MCPPLLSNQPVNIWAGFDGTRQAVEHTSGWSSPDCIPPIRISSDTPKVERQFFGKTKVENRSIYQSLYTKPVAIKPTTRDCFAVISNDTIVPYFRPLAARFRLLFERSWLKLTVSASLNGRSSEWSYRWLKKCLARDTT